MLRPLIDFGVPLLLPSLLWLIWTVGRQGRPLAIPWVWLAAAGAVLAFVVTMGGWLRTGTADGVYFPSAIGRDGRLVPGHVVPGRLDPP